MTRRRSLKPEHAPDDHPDAAFGRTGVLIANLGTPDGYGYWQMRRYLSEFLSDRRVIDYPAWKWQPVLQLIVLTKRPFSSGKAYESIWNKEADESPLATITKEQTRRLSERLSDEFGDEVVADYCMRYGNPSTPSKLRMLAESGCRRILFLPLYPQYSAATTASANDKLFRSLADMNWQPTVRVVEPYFDDPRYIDALARGIEHAVGSLEFEPELLLASYHGLPKRYLDQGDPYHCHCRKTSRLLLARLGWEPGRFATSFQSRFGPEEWLRPYTIEEAIRLPREGVKRLAVIAPGFASDCVETLEEIDMGIREAFLGAGGEEFAYVPCLNASDGHIDMLFELVRDNLSGWVG